LDGREVKAIAMQPQRPIYALSLRVLSAGAFATLLMLVKYAGESGIALPEIMFWRQAVTVPVILGWLWATGNLSALRTQRLAIHGRRAVLGMTNMIFNFGAAILLPLAISTVLGFTAPLFAVLIAALVLRDHIGPWRWSAVAMGFAGVLIVSWPDPGGEPVSTLGVTIGLVCAFLIAIINFQIRDLARTEQPIAIAFYFAAFGAPLVGLALPFFITPHTLQQWLVLLGIGLSGTIGQIFLGASLRHGSVASVIVMDYTTIIWATLYGWLVWDHLPTLSLWLGAPLIVAAGLTIAMREHRLSKAQPASTAVLESE
jgi:drug/metabolite transporter (DMT)-like permease